MNLWERLRLWFLRKKVNVIGGVWNKEDGVYEVLVTTKLSWEDIMRKKWNDEMQESDVVPEKVFVRPWKRVETKVIEVGEVKAEVYTERHRPLVGGVQIAPSVKGWYGTLGGFVMRPSVFTRKGYELVGMPVWMKKKLSGGIGYEFYGITNRHVALKDFFDKGSGVEKFTQPYDNSSRVLELVKVGREGLDCALLKPLVETDGSIVDIGVLGGVADISRGDQVQKHGARTGYTKGNMLRSGVSIQINMGGGKVKMFHDLMKFTKFSDSGDSGSFIVNMNNELVALLNAGSSSYTFGVPIVSVLKELQVEAM